MIKFRIVEFKDGMYVPQVKLGIFKRWASIQANSFKYLLDGFRFRDIDSEYIACKVPTLEEAGIIIGDFYSYYNSYKLEKSIKTIHIVED